MKRKHNNLAILSATRLACATISAAVLFETFVPTTLTPNDSERIPAIAGSEIPWQDGAENPDDGQGISPQNDEVDIENIPT